MKRKGSRRPATADATTTRPPPSLASFFNSAPGSASSLASSSSSTSSGQTLTPPVISQISRGVRTMLVNSFPYSPPKTSSPRRLLREYSLARQQRQLDYTGTTSAMSYSTASTSTYAPSDIPSLDFTIKRGKRHHAYPTKKAPYPMSYESGVLDHDVIDAEWTREMARSVTYHVFDTPPKKVLDLGCGTGAWILEAAKEWKDAKFVGYDIAPIQPDLTLLDPVLSSRSSRDVEVQSSNASFSSVTTLADPQTQPPRHIHPSNTFHSPPPHPRGRSISSGAKAGDDNVEYVKPSDYVKPRSSSLADVLGDSFPGTNHNTASLDIKSRQRRENHPPTSFSMKETNYHGAGRTSSEFERRRSKDFNFKSEEELDEATGDKPHAPKRIKRAKTLSERIKWMHGNFLEPLPFPDNYFDYIHIRKVARGIPETKWDEFFAEISRILKPGGAFEMFETDLSFPGGDFVPNPQIERRYWQDNHNRKDPFSDSTTPTTPSVDAFTVHSDHYSRYGAGPRGTPFARFLDEQLGLGHRYREMATSQSSPPSPQVTPYLGSTTDTTAGSDVEGMSSDASDPMSPTATSVSSTPGAPVSPHSPVSPALLKDTPWQSNSVTGGRIRPPSTLFASRPSSNNNNSGAPPMSEKGGDGFDGLGLTKIRTEGLDSVHGSNASTITGRRSAVSPPSTEHYQIVSPAPVISMWGVYYPPAQKIHARAPVLPRPTEKSLNPPLSSPEAPTKPEPISNAREASPIRHPDQLIRPYDPRDHTALQLIYEALHESRFINLRPLSLIYNYLVLHLNKVRSHPPVIIYAPERPKISLSRRIGACSDAVEERKHTHVPSKSSDGMIVDQKGLEILLSQAMPSMKRFLDKETPPSAQESSKETGDINNDAFLGNILAIDIARSGPLPTSVTQQLENPCLSNGSSKDPLEMLASEGSTDPPVSQMRQIIHEMNGLPNKSFLFDVRLLGLHLAHSVMGVLGCVEEMWEYVKSKEPEADRSEFDELVQRYAADMRHRIGLSPTVEGMLGWKTNKKDRSQSQKDFEAQLQRVMELEAEVERAAENADPNSPSSLLKESSGPKKMISRSLRVFVGWKI
ncbi:hypothetical protein FRC03_003842 [Tulasnella sp. 419]|nr:hypothetical protein FRC03_003842 [Tulasnella sp. 419]